MDWPVLRVKIVVGGWIPALLRWKQCFNLEKVKFFNYPPTTPLNLWIRVPMHIFQGYKIQVIFQMLHNYIQDKTYGAISGNLKCPNAIAESRRTLSTCKKRPSGVWEQSRFNRDSTNDGNSPILWCHLLTCSVIHSFKSFHLKMTKRNKTPPQCWLQQRYQNQRPAPLPPSWVSNQKSCKELYKQASVRHMGLMPKGFLKQVDIWCLSPLLSGL